MDIKIVNVFAWNNQGGNPCAIVDDATHLSAEEMQTMATQLNLPETVYVIPNKNQYLLRFFATKGELPLCCHGTLGAAFYLLKLKHEKNISLKTYRDNIKIDTDYCNNLISMSIANTNKIVDTNSDFATLSKLLNINIDSIAPYLPCAIASAGSPKLLIPVINRKILFDMEPNLNLIAQWSKNHAVNGLYVYSADAEGISSSYVGRNFNPLFSHQEDIATGVAAAALGKLLSINSGNLEKNYCIEQGANLGSPSKIYISIAENIIKIKGTAYFSN